MATRTLSACLPLLLVLAALPAVGLAQERLAPQPSGPTPMVAPFESATAAQMTPIDHRVVAGLKAKSIEPAHPCSDAIFLRRAFLDVIGTLPSTPEVKKFLQSKNPRKRALLVEALLKRDEFADYWAMKWCDLLRVKSEFPINLWPNGVQAYYRWIHDSLKANMPYDQFVRELLTSSGSNFRVPPVNFYRAVQGKKPSALAGAVALTFMGVRFEKLTSERQRNLETFFTRLAFKGTAEWKEEIVYLDPAPATPLACVFPDGTKTTVEAGFDPRQAFAQWLITPENPWFTRIIVNRVWSWLMGRGIIHEPDDIRPDNPPSNPALLAYLQKELVKAKYDLHHLFRIILNSRTYQQSSIPQSRHTDAAALFAYYPVRRLEAEVLADAFRSLCGAREQYSSMIPEPFTFIPPEKRTITLADGSITSPFLELFGRPPRDTGLESERNNNPSDNQRLYLLNSTGIQRGLQRSRWLMWLTRILSPFPSEFISTLYIAILSRTPTAVELELSLKSFGAKKGKMHEAALDLSWALINSKEFQYRH